MKRFGRLLVAALLTVGTWCVPAPAWGAARPVKSAADCSTEQAAAIDLRLPTGDERELLGAGGTQAKLALVASAEHGRFGQHLNIGYTGRR